MAHLRRLSLLLAFALATVSVAAKPAAPSYPGVNARIVFASGTNELWSVRPDGSGLQFVASVPSPPGVSSFVSFPSVSADGSKLAVMLNEFNRPTPCDPKALNAGSGLCRLIIVMNDDGSNQRVVYASEDIASLDLALSPDGRRIGFTKVTGGAREQIFTIGADGKQLRLLTRQDKNQNATDTAPSWSPDGTAVVFQSTRDQSSTHDWSLYSVSVRTRDITRILPESTSNDIDPDWAPDGRGLVFLRTFAFPDYRIFTVNRDGTGERQVLADASAPQFPAWSPDGTQISYLRDGQISLVNTDGSGPHDVTAGGSFGYGWDSVP